MLSKDATIINGQLRQKTEDANPLAGGVVRKGVYKGIAYEIKEDNGPGYIGETNLDDEIFDGMNVTAVEKDIKSWIDSHAR